jgi:hypothetical protein
MRPTIGFIAALSASATVFVLIVNLAGGLSLSIGYFLFAIAMSGAVGLPAVLLGGFPIWLAFRRHRINSVGAFAFAGAILALFTYLLLLGTGLLRSSDPPETFIEALGDTHRIAQLVGAVVAGGFGGGVFWLVAVKRSPETDAAPVV